MELTMNLVARVQTMAYPRSIVGILVLASVTGHILLIADSAKGQVGGVAADGPSEQALTVDNEGANPAIDGREEFSNSVGMRFVYIPSGSFVMNVPDPGLRDEPDVPAHFVRMTKPFYIATVETTQSEFSALMGFNPSYYTGEGSISSEQDSTSADSTPVENVTWNEANEFCRKLSDLPDEQFARRKYRLPTEAEWEYVSRGGPSASESAILSIVSRLSPAASDGNKQSGDEFPGYEVPPGTPNALGVYNMRGGVWEWCSDWYARDYYTKAPTDNPTGPDTGVLKVIRNTSWAFSLDAVCRITRYPMPPNHKCQFVGFRVVTDVQR